MNLKEKLLPFTFEAINDKGKTEIWVNMNLQELFTLFEETEETYKKSLVKWIEKNAVHLHSYTLSGSQTEVLTGSKVIWKQDIINKIKEE